MHKLIPIVEYVAISSVIDGNLLYLYCAENLALQNWEYEKVPGAQIGEMRMNLAAAENSQTRAELIRMLRLTRQTLSSSQALIKNDLVVRGKIALIDSVALKNIIEMMAEKIGYRKAKNYFKVFYYMYWNCRTYEVFSKSQKQMAQEIHINHSDLNEILRFLVAENLIKIKSGAYFNIAEGTGKSATYILGNYFS